MAAEIPVFWLEPTRRVQVRLRRFRFSEAQRCSADGRAGCDASVVIHPQAPAERWLEEGVDEGGRDWYRPRSERVAEDDPRWPSACERCGGRLSAEDSCSQVWADRLYRGAPDGRLYTLRDAPAGALYNAFWLDHLPEYTGADGIALTVVTPGGTWHVDAEATNCTRPRDRTHKCWVRHGDPRDPRGERTGVPLHVDKNGVTCAAGAGSIQTGRYHGFLHHGVLREC